MSGPPEDVPASELFLKLQEMPHPSEVIPFPRKTIDGRPVGTVRIMALPDRDHDTARKRALKAAKEKLGLSQEDRNDPLGVALVSDAVARELLAIACRTEENRGSEEKPFYPVIFPSADKIGEILTANELAVLFNYYLLVQAKWGPYEKSIQSEQDLSAWIKRLAEGAAEFPLGALSSGQSAELPPLLARRALTLSVVLESLWPSLPPTLRSRLETYSIGTSFFGGPARDSSQDGSGTYPNLQVTEEPLTIEAGKLLAQRLAESEAAALAALDEAERHREP